MTDDGRLVRVCRTATRIAEMRMMSGEREDLARGRMLLNGVVKKFRAARFEGGGGKEEDEPEVVRRLAALLAEVEGRMKAVRGGDRDESIGQ